jgi:hypothetical protein
MPVIAFGDDEGGKKVSLEINRDWKPEVRIFGPDLLQLRGVN